MQWLDFTRPVKNWPKSLNKISGKTSDFKAMDHNKQNEAKTNRKRPTIGVFPLDACFCRYTSISVNAKKKEWCLKIPGDARRDPAMPLEIR